MLYSEVQYTRHIPKERFVQLLSLKVYHQKQLIVPPTIPIPILPTEQQLAMVNNSVTVT